VIGKYADFIFVGGSICVRHDFDEAVRSIKARAGVPVVVFPGDSTQVSRHADALLFLSLVTSRNPDLLIGEHVKAAPAVKRHGLEVIPVAYMLVESGGMTSVQFISQSLAIPRGKPEIAIAHALAGEYLGMKLVFLEAGSGAERHVPPEMVEAVSRYVSVPVVVGGGIRDPESAREIVRRGASFIVTGDVIEKGGGVGLMRDFAQAVHGQ
jgi:phosphoglycerol geranylgeranyltransferase